MRSLTEKEVSHVIDIAVREITLTMLTVSAMIRETSSEDTLREFQQPQISDFLNDPYMRNPFLAFWQREIRAATVKSKYCAHPLDDVSVIVELVDGKLVTRIYLDSENSNDD
jgi:hypothetical protein